MNPKARLLIYVLLVVCMAAFAAGLYATYHAPETASPPIVSPTNTSPVSGSQTSAMPVASLTNVVSTTNAAHAPVTEAPDDAPIRKSSPRLGRMMGYGFATSYQYPGGLNLKGIAPELSPIP